MGKQVFHDDSRNWSFPWDKKNKTQYVSRDDRHHRDRGEDRSGRDREKEQMVKMKTYKRGFFLWKKTPELAGL